MAAENLRVRAKRLLAEAQAAGVTIATAESCTGGMIAAILTEIPGSSAVFERGFVTYSNDAKTEMLGVSADIIEAHGAVSEPVARAMAEGALVYSRATLAVSVTGVAGPGGGSEHKPVGLVWFGIARQGRPARTAERRFGDLGRDGVRAAAAAFAMDLLDQALAAEGPAASSGGDSSEPRIGV